MALTSATTNAVVDLCDDNDNVGSQTPVSTNPIESFERSCDNPECSAPRLISLVPKPATSEFVYDPMVVHQPTLINGFTTVFQIDGVGTRMEDIMNESTTGGSMALDGNKPKTVFRVVPNTHAHIVNYVVVEGAAETMQKIKANDPDTMCKLLISQRLSAEQMLKKLIGKALETSTRTENTSNIAAPNVVTAATAPPIPKAATPKAATPKAANPKAANPKAISIKPLPANDRNKTVKSARVKGPRLPVKPPSELNKTEKPSSGSAKKAPTNRISVKPASQLKSTRATENVSSNQMTSPNQVKLTTGAETSARPTTSVGRTITATKPVVWQAVPPGIASKYSPTVHKTSPLKSPSTNSSRHTQPVVPPLETSEPIDIEKEISSISIAVHRTPMDSNANKKENVLKRKADFTTPVTEAVKRLRPRSPGRIQNAHPLAGNNVSKLTDSPQISRKLPTLPKYQKPTLPPKQQVNKLLPSSNPKVQSVGDKQANTLGPDVDTNKKEAQAIDDEKSLETSMTESNASVRRKNKPLMGPASKMKALKAIAEAKTKALQDDTQSPSQSALNPESSPMKIGETIITRTSKSAKEPGTTLTKPCSVAVTDIAKANATTDSDSDSRTKRSRPTIRSTEKESSNTTNKKGNSYEPLTDGYEGRWPVKNEGESVRRPFLRATRSTVGSPKSAMKKTQKQDVISTPADDISDSTLLTTPSAPSRVLRVVLPSTKNGIVNNPSTAPHPNLKISSVISGGETTLATSMREVDTETPPIIIDNDDDSSGPGIEQLQKELADLRRTVARLTQGKK